MSEDCCTNGQGDCCKEQTREILGPVITQPAADPRVAALNEAVVAQKSYEGQASIKLAQEQISAILKETECRLVPMTQIVGNQVVQGVEIVYAPQRRIMKP